MVMMMKSGITSSYHLRFVVLQIKATFIKNPNQIKKMIQKGLSV